MGIKRRKANQNNGGESSVGFGLEGQGEGGLGPDLSIDNQGKVAVPNPYATRQVRLTEASGSESLLQSAHAARFASPRQKNKGASSAIKPGGVHNGRMSNSGWPYRDAFDRYYREYRERTGATIEQVAASLGRAVGTLNSYRRKRGAITPEPEVLVKAAQLFGCDVHEFMPDYQLLAAARSEVAELTDMDVYRTSEAARILTDGTISQEERDLLLQALRASRELLVKGKKR